MTTNPTRADRASAASTTSAAARAPRDPASVAWPVTGDPEADELLAHDPLALLVGMLLDQQVPMEWAFRGPSTLRRRLGGRLDATAIASMDPDELDAVFREKPALHRYPGAMAKRTQALCAAIVAEYGGDASRCWAGGTGEEVLARLRALPGYGDEKARILLAVLGKRLGVTPRGWQAAAAPFSDRVPRSVADIDSPEALARVRDWKRAQKAKGKTKAD